MKTIVFVLQVKMEQLIIQLTEYYIANDSLSQ